LQQQLQSFFKEIIKWITKKAKITKMTEMTKATKTAKKTTGRAL
jgi:hypothetical protein